MLSPQRSWPQLTLQEMIRDTIKTRTIYDALPVSFRLILLDTNLLVKKALHCLIQNSTSNPLSPHQN
jgi:5'-AMP-activated protein kinase regulatory gamma subunit